MYYDSVRINELEKDYIIRHNGVIICVESVHKVKGGYCVTGHALFDCEDKYSLCFPYDYSTVITVYQGDAKDNENIH